MNLPLRLLAAGITLSSLSAQVEVLPARTNPPAAFAVFGGDTVRIPLSLVATEGKPIGVSYSLFQSAGRAGAIAAPLVTDAPLVAPADAGPSRRRDLVVEVPVPSVARPTLLVVKFQASPAVNGPAQGTDSANLTVYPRPRAGEWAARLAEVTQRSGLALAVFGRSEAVRGFLTAQNIPFRDLGGDYPAQFPGDAVVVAEVTPADLERHRPTPAGGRKIFFLTDPFALPGISAVRTPDGSLTKVTLPIPQHLTDDPPSQFAFIRLLHQNLDPTDSEP